MENEVIEKKSNKGLYVVIIILSLLVVGFGGYFVYDKYLKDDKDINITNNTNDSKIVEPKEEKRGYISISDESETILKKYIGQNLGCTNVGGFFKEFNDTSNLTKWGEKAILYLYALENNIVSDIFYDEGKCEGGGNCDLLNVDYIKNLLNEYFNIMDFDFSVFNTNASDVVIYINGNYYLKMDNTIDVCAPIYLKYSRENKDENSIELTTDISYEEKFNSIASYNIRFEKFDNEFKLVSIEKVK